jgi:hypothetical protein
LISPPAATVKLNQANFSIAGKRIPIARLDKRRISHDPGQNTSIHHHGFAAKTTTGIAKPQAQICSVPSLANRRVLAYISALPQPALKITIPTWRTLRHEIVGRR